MRIAVLGPGHPFRGGIPRASTELVRALRARGHEVAFLRARRQYPRWLYPGRDDLDPQACPLLPDSPAVLEPSAPWRWLAARRAAGAAGAEVWLLPYWTWAWAGLWLALLADRARPPAIAVVHNPADHDSTPWQRAAARAVLGRCSGLFTHAEVLAAGLRRDYPGKAVAAYPLPAAEAPPGPLRAEARARLGLPESARLALFVGLIRPYKGADVLLEAVAALPAESGWRAHVAGEPWQGTGQALRRQAARLGLGERAALDLRWLAEDELAALMAAADVVVLPYRSATQSAVAPMALAAGVPVLASDVGGLAEVVVDGVNGRLLPPGSAPALARALTELDAATLARLAEGARASATRCTWNGYAGALEALAVRVGS